jgi:hypothetical protein
MTKQFTLAATLLALFLSPPLLYAVEDCGTSVTECKLWQAIKALQARTAELETENEAQQKRIAELEKANAQLRRQDEIAAARAICYSALTGDVTHSIILVPLPNHKADLDSICDKSIRGNWHAGGIAKANYFYQHCDTLTNDYYGGGYTSYVPEAYFEANRANYSNCGPSNAFICCSPQFPN